MLNAAYLGVMCSKNVGMNSFQRELLGLMSLDYESVETIRKELVEALGYTPSDEEIAKNIQWLVEEGLIGTYAYSLEKQKFDPVKYHPGRSAHETWYLATEKGRALELN